jgi:eukaryotic-like serine/threonine-protein kinase
VGSPSQIPPANLLGGKYRLTSRIGKGGMGNVWVARNEATQAEVAVKTLLRGERNEAHDERFRREARLAATVSHRNVIRVFDLVEDANDGTLALVMELLHGRSLERVMQERRVLSPKEAVSVAIPLLSALSHVHAKGIVHRDIKPGNVFFAQEPDGHVIPKLLDFGIAKLPAASSSLTRDGNVLGTPQYMSPEQIRGSSDDLDGRSDQFSAASLVYEMMTGAPCFMRESAAGSLAAVLEAEVDPDPRIPPEAWFALARALKKRPYERFDNCNELGEALRAAVGLTDDEMAACLQGLAAGAESQRVSLPSLGDGDDDSAKPVVVQLPMERRKWRVIMFAGAAAVGVLAAVGISSMLRSDPPTSAVSAPPAASLTAEPRPSAGPTIPPPEPSVTPAQPASATSSVATTAPSATETIELPATAPTAKPAGAKPAGTKPTGTKPTGTKPTGTKPTGTKPTGTKPVATSPGF